MNEKNTQAKTYVEYIKTNYSTPSQSIDIVEVYKALGKEQLKTISKDTDYINIIDELWDRKNLSRSDIFDFFQRGDIYKGYIASMLWGGLGADKTRWNNLKKALSTEKEGIEKRLKRILNLLANDKFEDAFKSMYDENKIEGIRVSYFTKLLYFLYPHREKSLVPLIYDKWGWHIHAALLFEDGKTDKILEYFTVTTTIKITKTGLSSDKLDVSLKNKKVTASSAYLDYITRISCLCQSFSHNNNPSPGQMEEFLFGRSRKQDKSETNPRIVLLKYLSKDLSGLIRESNCIESQISRSSQPYDNDESPCDFLPKRMTKDLIVVGGTFGLSGGYPKDWSNPSEILVVTKQGTFSARLRTFKSDRRTIRGEQIKEYINCCGYKEKQRVQADISLSDDNNVLTIEISQE